MHMRQPFQRFPNGLGHGGESDSEDDFRPERFRKRAVHKKSFSAMHGQRTVHPAAALGQARKVGSEIRFAAMGQPRVGSSNDKDAASVQGMLRGFGQGLPVEKRGRVRGVVGWRDGGHRPQVVQRFGERHVQVDTSRCSSGATVHGLVQGGACFGPQGFFGGCVGIQHVGMDGVQAVNFTLVDALPVPASDHIRRAVRGQA